MELQLWIPHQVRNDDFVDADIRHCEGQGSAAIQKARLLRFARKDGWLSLWGYSPMIGLSLRGVKSRGNPKD